ncbi:hypothetical protein CJ030_MR3G023991 [Morella rubra]|uniref:Uncharacterized protein n=1 Tax=Morella rubra TaxID=262757 RepID=A0A6A1W6K5_9ROSI|nr:hypothetical protein CJ030_MR3G023991 [Morella rubra]
MAESMVTGMMRLSASNYMNWKPRMENILYAKDMYDPLENEVLGTSRWRCKSRGRYCSTWVRWYKQGMRAP